MFRLNQLCTTVHQLFEVAIINEGESDDNDNNDDVKAMPQGLFD